MVSQENIVIERIKFKKKLNCICNTSINFEFIEEIECDWGSHVTIQCPNCEELFSIDKKCPAFNDALKLSKINDGLYSKLERNDYVHNCHPC